LILLFLYIGYIALRSAIDDTAKADKASAVLALVGAVNVPIIHFSVEWWSSLHQGPTLVREGGPAMDPAMLYPLLAMILGFTLVFGGLLLRRVRSEVLARERRTRWVKALVLAPKGHV
jgi:heme exporter protein C